MVKPEIKNSPADRNESGKNDASSMMLSNVDLKLLRVYKCIVEAGGFTAASLELNVGLATISKQISDLEVRLGLTLCSRGREGFELTEYGINVYEATNELLNSMELFREKLYSTRKDILGDMVIAVVDNTISDTNSPLIAAIKNLHISAPKLNLRLQTLTPEEIERGVNDGRIHCGVVPVQEHKPEFDYFPLYREKVKLYCAASHPLAAQQPAGLLDEETLRNQKIIHHMTVPQGAARRLVSSLPVRIQAINVESVAMLILTGEFIGYLPEHYARHCIAGDQLVALGDESLTLEMEFFLLIKKGRKSSPMIRKLMESL